MDGWCGLDSDSSVTVKGEFSYIIYIFTLDVPERLPYTQADTRNYRTASSYTKVYPPRGVKVISP